MSQYWKAGDDQIRLFLKKIKSKDLQINTNYFQREIDECFENFKRPTEQIFELAYSIIDYYGFTPALSLRILYQKLTSYEKNHFRNKMIELEFIIREILGESNFEEFTQLDFMNISGKSQKKKLKKNYSTKLKNTPNQDTQQPNIKFQKYICNLRKLANEIDLKNMKTGRSNLKWSIQNCYNILTELDTEKGTNMNHFQVQYRFFMMKKIEKSVFHWSSNFVSQRDKQIADNIVKYINNDLQPQSKQQNIINQSSKPHALKRNRESTRESNNITFQLKNRNSYITWKNQIRNHNSMIQDNKFCIQDARNNIQKYNRIKNELPPNHESNRMCCRTYFYEGEMIEFPESIRRQYKNYAQPLSPTNIDNLKKTITGFLNSIGGIIYMGIKEEENRLRRVASMGINQMQKQILLFSMRQICESIQPEIITSRLFTVKFIPVKSSKNHQFMPGRYIVKFIVQMGEPRQIYSYNTPEGHMVAFRTENQVIAKDPKKDFRKLFAILKNRLTRQLRPAQRQHEGVCCEPQIGVTTYN